ncbi:MAG: universal stress protein [Pseudonocardia sp.]|nr:universal stress protein [Pseudonocardia sp.]
MTDPVRSVLAGADGSAASMLAVAWAAADASRRGLPLTIACVTGTRRVGPLLAASIVEGARGLARAVAPGLPVRTVVRDGDPVEVLSDLGRDCELLVVGHRGDHGHPGPGPGSTSESLARFAPVMVAVVDMDEERFPLERCTGPALPPPAAVRQDRPLALRISPLHGAEAP